MLLYESCRTSERQMDRYRRNAGMWADLRISRLQIRRKRKALPEVKFVVYATATLRPVLGNESDKC